MERNQQPLAKKLFGLDPKVAAIVCLVYVLSPVDLLPEIVLGPCAGLLDDFGVAGVGLYSLVQWLSTGHAPTPATAVAGTAPEPRTVTVLAQRSTARSTIDDRATASPLRANDAPPARTADRPGALFCVQLVDDNGADERRVEVAAKDANDAKRIVTAMGGDARIGKVWLVRFLELNGAEPRSAGVSDELDG